MSEMPAPEDGDLQPVPPAPGSAKALKEQAKAARTAKAQERLERERAIKAKAKAIEEARKQKEWEDAFDAWDRAGGVERENAALAQEEAEGQPPELRAMNWGWRNLGAPILGTPQQESCRNWYKRDENQFIAAWGKLKAEFQKYKDDQKAKQDQGGMGPFLEYVDAFIREYEEEKRKDKTC